MTKRKTSKKSILPDDELDALAAEILAEIAVDQPEDLPAFLEFIEKAASSTDAIKNLLKYKHMPVGPREFVDGAEYLNRPGKLWPLVMDEFVEINSGKYVECVLTGAIGVAKTTIALYTQAYQVYLLSCLRDPHAEMDLDSASEILIVFQSKNKALAKDLDFGRFRAMMADAPYFKRFFPFDETIMSEMRFPHRIIIKPIAGTSDGAIGQNVIGGIIDEINFMAVVENSKMKHANETYNQATENYNSIASRRTSRFLQKGGDLPGMLCLVSSRNYPGQFTDKKEAEAKTNPLIYVYDKRLWEVRPERFEQDPSAWFNVFVGDSTRKPRIMEEDEEVSEEEEALVMSIPLSYMKQFENDMLGSLRDVAGVSTLSLHPFMLNTEAVSSCFSKRLSIASRTDVDFHATKLQLYPKRVTHPDEPRFAHVDLAISKDSAGIAIGYVSGFKKINRGDRVETMPIIEYDLILEVRPPRGGEIEFENIRKLFYTLRDKMGIRIKWVSFDQFQSRDSMQIMHNQGFLVGYQSMDADITAYSFLKQAFYDGRIRAPEHEKALYEMVTLEIDVKKNKVDHPPHSSKDIADAMAGVAYGLTIRREIWLRHGISSIQIPKAVTEFKSSVKTGDEPRVASRMQQMRAKRYA